MKKIEINQIINNCKIINLVSGNTSKTRRWKLECVCGNKYIKNEETLKHGNPKICICSKYNKLVGTKINSFTIKSFNIKNKKYFCECVCGKEYYKTKYQIFNTKSCGCLHEVNLTNKKYERLLYLEKINNKWKCVCDCGNIKYYSAKQFGKIKSCGCLVVDKAKETIEYAIKKTYKDEFNALRKRFKCNYSEGNISFEEFYKLSQQDCYYCGSKPSNLCKNINKRHGRDIYYNGLDRIDNNLGHNIENVVSCCIICNRSKANRDLKEFIDWAKNIQIRKIDYIVNINLEEKYNVLKINYKENYSDGLLFEEFIGLAQMKCHYCGAEPINKKENIYWNGVDRIDSNLDHRLSNCVPCCRHCNFAKSNLNIQDFYNHIEKIKVNLKL